MKKLILTLILPILLISCTNEYARKVNIQRIEEFSSSQLTDEEQRLFNSIVVQAKDQNFTTAAQLEHRTYIAYTAIYLIRQNKAASQK